MPMSPVEIFLILLFTVCAVAVLAQRVNMAYPIAFVLAGMGLALVPQFPAFQIPPDAILLLFLPPLLTEAAYFTSLRDFKANVRPILQLAVGLVIVSCVITAYTLDWIAPDVGLGVGFVLGAIISPPDAVAAVSVTRSLTVPKRIMTILEGESLVNDVTGLVLYKFAVAAVVTGTFSFAEASLHFVWMAVSGIGIGWAIGWSYMRLFPRIKEMSVEILSTFLVPYIAYVAVESLHGSGVLAVVANGLTVGWYAPQRFSPTFRIPAAAVWRMVTFVLNGLVFLLIGLHVPGQVRLLNTYSAHELFVLAASVSLIAIITRFIWVYAIAYGTRFLMPRTRQRDPYPPWQNVFIIAWTGMRGVVSLATALAVPLAVADGWTPFPHRELIIFLAFSVIVTTLVLQGLPLPWIIRKLSLTYDANILQEQWQAQKDATEAALKRLEELCQKESMPSAALERIVSHYKDRLESLGDGPNTPLTPYEAPNVQNHPIIQNESRIFKEALEAERSTIIHLRQAFKISDDVMHDLLRDVDLLHNRFANSA